MTGQIMAFRDGQLIAVGNDLPEVIKRIAERDATKPDSFSAAKQISSSKVSASRKVFKACGSQS